MIDEIQLLVDRYSKWLRDQTNLRSVGDSVEITTPYLDRHNDCLQIYVKSHGDSFILSDDGYILDDLAMSGCEIKGPKRESLLETTLKGFGVNRKARSLEVHATTNNFALQKHNLVQAMIAVNDLFHLSTSSVTNLFHEDVNTWLEESDIRSTPNVTFKGSSGFDHRFDYVIPRSKLQPERVIRVMNRPARDTAGAVVFSWIDVKKFRPVESRAYAIINDTMAQISGNVTVALNNHGVCPCPWSKRQVFYEELAA